jgi:serine/threonine-protein kinase
MKSLPGIVVLTLAVLAGSAVHAAGNPLALQARDILKERCHGCHKGPGSKGGRFNAFVFKSLLTAEKAGEKPVVVPKKLVDSELWQRIEAGDMPEAGSIEKQKFTGAEKETLKHWIEEGAPEWAAVEAQPNRPIIRTTRMLEAIRDDLRTTRADDRIYLRYYTLTHLYNQPRTRIADSDLRLYRAAFSKAINSMSWKRRIVIPRAVDKEETIFCVDLRDLDWDRDGLWKYVVGCYPYGLSYDSHRDAAYREPYLEIVALCGNRLPFVRADWFAAVATRPPLYHALVQMPKRADELEQKLGVDIPQNFGRDRLMRAGFAKSRVSQLANRLIERHESNYGAYWKSYDFRSGGDRSRLTEYPLGPVFKGNEYNEDLAFHQAGGEIIFNLPNGMQAYMLVNGKDERIDAGPIDVVSDSQKTSGTPVIVNGLSCIACHNKGMITDFTDEIRLGTGVGGPARVKVDRLYPDPRVLAEQTQKDSQQFLEADRKAMGPFLQVGEDAQRPIESFDEPIGKIARYYRSDDLDAPAAAAELGVESPERLIGAIEGNRTLRGYGLGPLAQPGGHVKRGDWEKLEGNSVMQRTARELELGTPCRESVSGFPCQ